MGNRGPGSLGTVRGGRSMASGLGSGGRVAQSPRGTVTSAGSVRSVMRDRWRGTGGTSTLAQCGSRRSGGGDVSLSRTEWLLRATLDVRSYLIAAKSRLCAARRHST